MKMQKISRGLLLLLVAAVPLQNAMSQDKLFEAALKEGRSRGAFFVAKNEKGKATSVEKMRKYASEHNYIVGEYTERTVDKFGDKASAVNTFEFLPLDMYREYIYETLTSSSRPSFSEVTQLHKGSCYVFMNDEFKRLDNIYWTGKVVDGMIDGKGFGFQAGKPNADAGIFSFINGTFQKGLPNGESSCSFYTFNSHNDKPKQAISAGTHTAYVGELKEGLAYFRGENGKYGFVKNDGSIVVMPAYDRVLKDYINGKAEVVDAQKGEIIIDTKGAFVDLTDRQKEANAEAERVAAEAKRAKELAAIEEKKARERAEQEAIERQRRDYEMKKDCVGKTITWTEKLSFDTSVGGLVGILQSAAGLGTTSYIIRYTAIVETVIGESAVKCIIRNANIEDPAFASVNYFKYKDDARDEMRKNLGQTRVLDFSEFELR